MSSAECTSASGSFVLGGFSPDAFKKAHPTLHSFEYAAFQLEYAMNNTISTSEKSSSAVAFDAVTFSKGFAAHLLQDYVGHHSNGFLNPKEDHPLELSVDALMWSSRSSGFQLHTADTAAFEFFSNATQAFALFKNDSTLHLTPSQASFSWEAFDALMISELVIISLDFTYKQDILKYDVCGAKTVDEALANFNYADSWVTQAVQLFLNTVEKPSHPVHVAFDVATAWVNKQFDSNNGTNCAHSK